VAALFAVAAGRSSEPVDLNAVLADLGLSLADLAPAERATLIAVRPDQVELRHPLVRDVVVLSTPVIDQCRMNPPDRPLRAHEQGGAHTVSPAMIFSHDALHLLHRALLVGQRRSNTVGSVVGRTKAPRRK